MLNRSQKIWQPDKIVETPSKAKSGAQESRLGVPKLLIRIANVFITALFPTRCLVCGSFFQSKNYGAILGTSRGIQQIMQAVPLSDKSPLQRRVILDDYFKRCFEILLTPFLCRMCLSGFDPLESPLCVKCGTMFISRIDADHLCGECLNTTRSFRTARASGLYSRTLMDLIHCYKYGGKTQLAAPLGVLLFVTLMRHWDVSAIDLVLPVPLHLKRLRHRGFNQAFLLIRDWSRIAKNLHPGLCHMQIAFDVLIRNKWTESQTGLARRERKANIKNAFSVKDPLKIEKKRIVLVDDVYTTGATVDECAKVLLAGGAQTVDVLTLARAL